MSCRLCSLHKVCLSSRCCIYPIYTTYILHILYLACLCCVYLACTVFIQNILYLSYIYCIYPEYIVFILHILLLMHMSITLKYLDKDTCLLVHKLEVADGIYKENIHPLILVISPKFGVIVNIFSKYEQLIKTTSTNSLTQKI